MSNLLKNRKAVLLIGAFNFLCIGVMYSWSKFSLAIRSELDLNHATSTAVYSICMGVFTIGILLDGILVKKLNSKVVCISGSLMCALGYLLTSNLLAQHHYLIYLTYGILIGFGNGLVYNEWLNNTVQLFPEKSGFAVGLLLLGMGISGITITPLLSYLANAYSWRFAFRVMAVLIAIIGTYASFFVVKKENKTVNNNYDESKEFTPKEMVKTSSFWFFAVWKIILIGSGQAYSGQVSNIIYDMNCSDLIQLISASLFILCNGTSRLVWGMMLDKMGNRKLMLFTSGLLLVSIIVLRIALLNSSIIIAIISLMFIAMAYGGTSIMGTNFVSSTYGKKNYRMNNGISAFTSIPGSIGLTYITGAVRQKYGNFNGFININIPIAFISIILLLFIKETKKEEN